ncbi:MAG: ABC transporter permease [Chloroflexi bacterium]|nr:ABC transporter permease [Chloroflexota bacterium]
MQAYIARRLLASILVLFIVTLVIFGLMRLVPGDIVDQMAGQQGMLYQKNVQEIRERLGLTKPIHEQYLNWIGGILHGDLGKSMWTEQSAGKRISDRIPVTLELGLMSLFIALLIAIPVGVISSIRQDSLLDQAGRLFSIGGLSFPDFWLGTMFVLYAALWFHYQAPIRFVDFFDDPLTNLRQVGPAAVIMGIRLSSTTMRMLRSAMLEVLRQDYVRTAWSKGLRERAVITRHVLKNAMIPVITIFGNQVSLILGGTVIMETLFSLPGMGRLTIDAINQRDYTQVQANVLVLASFIVFANLVVDISYTWFDPRIRYR